MFGFDIGFGFEFDFWKVTFQKSPSTINDKESQLRNFSKMEEKTVLDLDTTRGG